VAIFPYPHPINDQGAGIENRFGSKNTCKRTPGTDSRQNWSQIQMSRQTTKKCSNAINIQIPLLLLLLLVKLRQSLLSKGIGSFKDSTPSFKQNKIETLAGG
jgi:hypothetical protein